MSKLLDFMNKRMKRPTVDQSELTDAANLTLRIAKVANSTRVSSSVPERTIETRDEARFVPAFTSTSFTLKNGKRHDARIMNISRYGVALDADFSKIDVADVNLVGAHQVTHIRNLRKGSVFRFKTPLDPKLCTTSIIL